MKVSDGLFSCRSAVGRRLTQLKSRWCGRNCALSLLPQVWAGGSSMCLWGGGLWPSLAVGWSHHPPPRLPTAVSSQNQPSGAPNPSPAATFLPVPSSCLSDPLMPSSSTCKDSQLDWVIQNHLPSPSWLMSNLNSTCDPRSLLPCEVTVLRPDTRVEDLVISLGAGVGNNPA